MNNYHKMLLIILFNIVSKIYKLNKICKKGENLYIK